MCWWPAWQLSLTDTHTCTHIQGLVGLEPWIECATQFVQTPNRLNYAGAAGNLLFILTQKVVHLARTEYLAAMIYHFLTFFVAPLKNE